jgi:hypothetical protein
MGTWAYAVLVGGALVLGMTLHRNVSARERTAHPYEWLFAAVGCLIGGAVASLAFGLSLAAGASTVWARQVDGLYVLPAVLGAAAVGGLLELVVRATSERSAA